MKKPNEFNLQKVKLLKNGGIDITYREQVKDKGITDTFEWNIKKTINPHPDLINAIEKLKPFLATCYGLDQSVILANSKGLAVKDEEAFQKVSHLLENAFYSLLKKIDITGLSIGGSIDGEKDKRSVVITATQLMTNNSKTALNSPRIRLETNQFTFEADVQEIVNEISEEVVAYLFDGKKAQLELFDATPQLSDDFKQGNIGKGKKKNELKVA